MPPAIPQATWPVRRARRPFGGHFKATSSTVTDMQSPFYPMPMFWPVIFSAAGDARNSSRSATLSSVTKLTFASS